MDLPKMKTGRDLTDSGLSQEMRGAMICINHYLTRLAHQKQAVYLINRYGPDPSSWEGVDQAQLYIRCMKWEVLKGAGSILESVLHSLMTNQPFDPDLDIDSLQGILGFFPQVVSMLYAGKPKFEIAEWLETEGDRLTRGVLCQVCAKEWIESEPHKTCEFCGYTYHVGCGKPQVEGEPYVCAMCVDQDEIEDEEVDDFSEDIDGIDDLWSHFVPATPIQRAIHEGVKLCTLALTK